LTQPRHIGIEMSSQMIETVRDAKSRVNLMLDKERMGTSNPSEVWSGASSMFDYLLDMPDRSFSKIRLHTYFLTGDYYLPYSTGRGNSALRRRWKTLKKGIPDEYLVYEPQGGIGCVVNGQNMVSRDSLRYQKTINTIYRYGLFPLLKNDENKVILEIGGGYGGFAHHLSSLSNSTTYIIVDLPETFIFSAPYIALHNPGKNIYVYDENDFDEVIQSDISHLDFMFIPNYKLADLLNIEFDLVINANSLQEMTTTQVNQYLDFISKTCKGTFYSCNLDRLLQNQELVSLFDLLTEKFEVTDVTSGDKLKRTAKSAINIITKLTSKIVGKRPTQYQTYREFMCKPR